MEQINIEMAHLGHEAQVHCLYLQSFRFRHRRPLLFCFGAGANHWKEAAKFRTAFGREMDGEVCARERGSLARAFEALLVAWRPSGNAEGEPDIRPPDTREWAW